MSEQEATEQNTPGADGTVKLELVRGPEGMAVYLNSTRIAGPKPWGGGPITRSWTVRRSDLAAALKAAS